MFRALSPEDILTRSRGLEELFDQLSLGYADHAAFGTGLLQAGEHFIQKPFATAALTSKVRDILDGRAAVPLP